MLLLTLLANISSHKFHVFAMTIVHGVAVAARQRVRTNLPRIAGELGGSSKSRGKLDLDAFDATRMSTCRTVDIAEPLSNLGQTLTDGMEALVTPLLRICCQTTNSAQVYTYCLCFWLPTQRSTRMSTR